MDHTGAGAVLPPPRGRWGRGWQENFFPLKVFIQKKKHTFAINETHGQ